MPLSLTESIDCAEEADKRNDYGTFSVYADNIDIMAKNCYVCGTLIKEMRKFLDTHERGEI